MSCCSLCQKHALTYLLSCQDLLNFDDPLNVEAAELYAKDKVSVLVCSCLQCYLLHSYHVPGDSNIGLC